MTSWMINSEMEDGLVGKIMSCSRELSPPYDLTVQVQLPDEWDPKLGRQNIGVSAFVETTKCNPTWIQRCDQMDEIIVPSTFIEQVISNSGSTKTKVTVVPEHFNKFLIKNSHNESLNLNLQSKFNFLLIGQLTGNTPENDRKNTENAIKWFCREFKDNKNVGLIVKTNLGRCTLKDRKATLSLLINIVKKERPGNFPRIEFVHGNLTDKEMSCIYKNKNIKCLISATRGEGYGLPLVDAAASGMPVMVAPWSGHMEFLEEDKIVGLEYVLDDIHESRVDERIFMKGSRWAKVNEKDFRTKLRYKRLLFV
jgi:glycosyltransferase involved in cell wall biosynthesis